MASLQNYAAEIWALPRDAHWLHKARVTAYLWCVLVVLILSMGVLYIWAAFHGNIDFFGRPIGADFPSFWAASDLALQGHAQYAYDVTVHHAAQRALFNGTHVDYAAFFYPPPYLLMCLPLALLPYFPSLLIWQMGGAALLYRALKPVLPDNFTRLVLAAYPAVFSNIGHGQNAFVTAALFIWGLTRLDKRPILAGVALGLLIIKPQLALLLPIILIARGRWRTMMATGCTVFALCILSYVIFGAETWKSFLASNGLARAALEHNLVGNEKMQSTFAGVRLLSGGILLAWLVQALVSGVVTGFVFVTVRKIHDAIAGASVAAAGALLVSPFLLDYDLMFAALPLLWVIKCARHTIFLPWEKAGLALVFVLPMLSRLIGGEMHIPLAPFVDTILLFLVVRRAHQATAEDLYVTTRYNQNNISTPTTILTPGPI